MTGTEDHVRIVRVVVVSPSDVKTERASAEPVVEELNRGICRERRCRIELWRWETDARPGFHLKGPQGIVDDHMDLERVHLVVGVFWKRFGTPTAEAGSGTEHELRRAWALFERQRRPEVMLYFRNRAYSPKTPDELSQWQRVLDFRAALPPEQHVCDYTSAANFRDLLREHLSRFVQAHVDAPKPVRRIRFNVPAVAASFTGRQAELAALHAALQVDDRAVITQAITGLGGVGKSQLAARYVQQHADDYAIVAWIRAEDGGIADLATLAARLLEPSVDVSPGDRAELALAWLSTCDERWLLVLDNIESPVQLERLCPRTGTGRVLVTSRDRALRQFGQLVPVDVFDGATATAYLVDRAERPGDDAAARQLAMALGCLPLALSHAAAFCQSGTSFADYLELLGELPAPELFDSHPETSYAQTVASTWKASIERASAEAQLAGGMLELAGHLGPDAIPRELFEVLADTRTAVSRKRLADAFNALARFSLATVEDDTVSVHRLLQKTIRDEAAAHGNEVAARRALAAFDKMLPVAGELPEHWPAYERLLPHVLALADAMPEPGDIASELVRKLTTMCDYLLHAEPGGRGLEVARRTAALAERVVDADHVDALRAREAVAAACRRSGHLEEAVRLHEALSADAERVLGTDDDHTLSIRHNLAIAYVDSGRTGDAIAIYEPLLAQIDERYGWDDENTLPTRDALAVAYTHAGRASDAIELLEPLVEDVQRVLGKDHPYALLSRGHLASAYNAGERVDEAMAIYEVVVADSARIFGAEHVETLTARQLLGEIYAEAGRGDAAVALLEPLVATSEQLLGTGHDVTCASRRTLAIAYRAAGRDGDADALEA